MRRSKQRYGNMRRTSNILLTCGLEKLRYFCQINFCSIMWIQTLFKLEFNFFASKKFDVLQNLYQKISICSKIADLFYLNLHF